MKIVRPWGTMWKFFHTEKAWLKFIVVRGRTSLQSHSRRTEWHLGLYKVEPMQKHRLLPGAYFEFVYGNPDENDIIRYEDDYGRETAKRIIMVSGGFDPVHIGHLQMFEEAKKLGDKLVVVLNSDEWLVRKKGKYFMNQEERAAIVRGFACVDDVFILESDRNDVGEAIEKIRPHVFANGGDRKDEKDIPEAEICQKLGVEMVFNVGGGKVQSSSELLKQYGE
ncbi:MAG: adenylyltransferase/cytidyltransferase family protein [Minisyncoccota bacterium]